ncbi:MAG: Thiamine-monophosphate kinase [Chlamydiae bacterium]|nr:Thiamine-monophosphate kinase [Chlamydiota bacterium]
MQEYGEEGFIEYLAKQFPCPPPIFGIGDDCGVIPADNESVWLITTDSLVEGVHFLKEQISPQNLGYKVIAVNVSDIAAMGGTPKYAFLSISLPSDIDSDWLEEFTLGVKEACSRWNLLLLGGDTVGSKRDLFLSGTVMGVASKDKVKYRHQAKVGDVICVTNTLGNSGGGLKLLQSKVAHTEEALALIHSHFHPDPSPEEGRWLASQKGIHAMMDISDGLSCDLGRLIRASKCGAIIEISNLPISDPLSHICSKENWDPINIALTGGEDYSLLCTLSKKSFQQIADHFSEEFDHPLHEIGQVTSLEGEIIYRMKGKVVEMDLQPFDHFR